MAKESKESGKEKALKPDFAHSSIRVRSKVAAKNAVLLMGLPGIGLVSKLAVDGLVKQLKAKHFATLYSPHFPNQVVAMPSGKLKPFVLKFYFKKLKGAELVILRGDLQPLTVEGQYEVCGKALNFFAECGGKEVIAMAGYATQKKPEKPRVFCAATGPAPFNAFKKIGAKQLEGMVPIVGMAGLVPALAPLYGLDGSCLLVETSGTVFDAVGARALLDIVGKKLGQQFDAANLEAQAKKAQQMMEKIEEQAKQEAARAGSGVPAEPEAIKRESLSYIR